MQLMRMSVLLLRRDWRNGELSLLLLALLVAVTATAALGLFSDRLQRTLNLQAAQFLAGDLAVSGSQPLAPEILQQAQRLAVQQSQTAEFTTMLLENQQMLLVAAKSVTATYPLRGQLIVQVDDQELIFSSGPAPGEVWVDQRVLNALKLQPGAVLQVGERGLRVSGILRYEPDKAGDFYAFLPRVMFNWADLAATEVVQPGSRLVYAYQFRGGEPAIKALAEWLKSHLVPGQKILDIYQDRPELGNAFRRAERYLGLSSVLVILLAGVAIAMAAGRYSERHFAAVAILRCLGGRQNQVLSLFLLQILWLGAITSLIGCGLGWLAQEVMLSMLDAWLPKPLAAPSLGALWLAWGSGLLLLLGFALPPLLRLRRVSPLRVLRQDVLPMPASVWLVYGLALLMLLLFVMRYSRDAWMAVQVLVVSVLLLGLLAGLIRLGFRGVRALQTRLGMIGRLAVQSLLQYRGAVLLQILAFSLTLAAMLFSYSLRSDLVADWRQHLSPTTPNYFVINILPEFKDRLAAELQQAEVVSSDFYPVIRGRLLAINGQPVSQRVSKDSQGEAATQRELSLTTVHLLPPDNPIVEGANWPDAEAGWVSVEQKLAQNLGIRVGDTLDFSVGSAPVQVKVSSLRRVEWDTLKPNFYMMFSPGTLDPFPTTWMTSFYLPTSQKQQLNQWVQHYPAITVLEVEQWLRQIQALLGQITVAVDYLLYFALAAGVCVLLTAISASLDQRLYQGALMRTLGASNGLLLRIQVFELALLGGLSGMLAVLISECLRWVMYRQLLHMDFHWVWLYWLAMPLLAILLVVTLGLLGLRRVLRQPPLTAMLGRSR